MSCFSSPSFVPCDGPWMTPDKKCSYTPSTSDPSDADWFLDWPTTTTTTSECGFSPLQSEQWSPAAPCGLGLYLSTFDFDGSNTCSQDVWPMRQLEAGWRSSSSTTMEMSGLPHMPPKCLNASPLFETQATTSASLLGTSWDAFHASYPNASRAHSPAYSIYTTHSHTSPVPSPLALPQIPAQPLGSPFIKIEPPQDEVLFQLDDAREFDLTTSISPHNLIKQSPGPIQDDSDMFAISSEHSQSCTRDTTALISPLPMQRGFTPDPKEVEMLCARPKRKYTTIETARLSCHICGKLFQRRFNQRKHMETHEPARIQPFACEHEGCSRRFARRTDLARHQKSVRNTPIAVCSRCFANDLQLHLQERDHVCDMCDAAFARKDTLRR